MRNSQSTSTLRLRPSPSLLTSSRDDWTSAWPSKAVTPWRRSSYPGIAGSKAPRNSPPWPALRSEATELTSSHTSSAESARRLAARAANSSVRRVNSGPVAGIDLNVTLGEIAGPEARGALALTADGHPDFALRRFQPLLELRFGEGRGQAAPAHRHILHVNVGLGGVEGHTGIARGRKNTAPIGIGPGNGRLDQRRIGDGARDLCCTLVGWGAGNHDGDQLPGAFSISCDGLGQRFHHASDRFLD